MEKSKKAVKGKKRQVADDSNQEDAEDENKNGASMKLKKSSSRKNRSTHNDNDDEFDIEDDNFNSGHHEQMRQMDQMFMSPFGGFGGGMLALPQPSTSDRRRQQQQAQQQAQNMQMAERNMFMDPFAHFGSMFSNMRSMMTDMHRAFDQISTDPSAHVYQQQSFMSYSNTGEGAPKVYQASASTRQGPGGVKETRKTVRDSETGVEKIAVGHHINDRAHIMERGRNNKTGEQNENQEYVNLDEEEANPFDQEYQEKWHTNMAMRGIEPRRRGDRSRHASLTGDSPYHRTRHAALPEPPRNRKPSSSRRE